MGKEGGGYLESGGTKRWESGPSGLYNSRDEIRKGVLHLG